MSYVRVCRNVNVAGNLVQLDEVDDFIKSQEGYENLPWYTGVYTLPNEAFEYFEKNGQSIKGYVGEALCPRLFWDLDSEKDLEKVKHEAAELILFLFDNFGVSDGIEVFFSGNKGFHINLETEQSFTPEQVKRITAKIAREAGALDTYDPSVYNSTRIFRYPNSKHEKSGLWKVPISVEELVALSAEEIKQLADKPRSWEEAKSYPGNPVDATEIIEKYDHEEQFIVDVPGDHTAVNLMRDLTGDGPFDRQCIRVLQEGNFGPGERENALIRMASYYRNCNLTFEQVYEKLSEALVKRDALYDDLNPYSDYDTKKVVNQVFDPSWRGGMFSCKTDHFLIDKCSNGGTGCAAPKPVKEPGNEMQFGIGGLLKNYVKHGDDAIKEFPKTGLANLDRMIKLRRQNISIVAGAPGSGKTSLILEIMESLNKQQIHHMLFSLDMSAPSLFEMLGVRYTNYTSGQIEAAFSAKSRDIDLMREIGERLTKELPYSHFDISTAVDLKHIDAAVQKFNEKLDTPIEVCFIDYAGRLMGAGDSAHHKAAANALLANDVAKTSNSHLMFIAQVSREAGDHTTPLHSNRVSMNSSEWEANATFVLSVWRPFGKGLDAEDKYMHIFIGKNRSGPSKELYYHWNGSRRRIRPLKGDELTAYSDLCQTFNKPVPNQRELAYEEDKANAYSRHAGKSVPTEADGKTLQDINQSAKEALKDADTNDKEEKLPSNQPFGFVKGMSKRNSRRS